MTVKRNIVKRNFSQGEISDDYRASLDSELLNRSVLEMTNFMPLRSGGVRRRPSTQMIGTWQASNLDGTDFHVFKKRDGTYILIISGTSTVKQMTLDTGTISTIGSLTAAPGDQAVQVGPSLFFSALSNSAQPGIARLIEDSTGDMDIYGPGGTDGSLLFYIELRGLWDHDNAAATITAVSGDPDAILDEELVAFPAAGLFGTETKNITAAASRTSGTLSAALNNSFGGSPIAVKFDDWTGPTTIHDKNCQGEVIGWHQGRLVVANTTAYTSGSWDTNRSTRLIMSRTNNPFVLLTGQVDDGAPIDINLLAPNGSVIKWVKSIANNLYIGIGNSILLMPGVITPGTANYNLNVTTNLNGDVIPTQDNESLYFIGEDSGALHSVRFEEVSEVTRTRELSKFAYHLLNSVGQMAINYPSSYDPVKRLYLLSSGGSTDLTVASFLSDDPNATPAFCTFRMAPSTGLTVVGGSAETFTIEKIIPAGVDVYAIVERSSNSDRCLVKFVDSSVAVGDFYGTISSANASTWATGNSALAHQYLHVVLYDNGTHVFTGPLQCNGVGTFTTPVTGDVVYYALPFDSSIEMFDIATEDFSGPTDHRFKKVIEHRLYVKDTKMVYVNDQPMMPDVPPTPTAELPSVTGAVVANKLNWERETNFLIRAAHGYPCNILAVSTEVEI